MAIISSWQVSLGYRSMRNRLRTGWKIILVQNPMSEKTKKSQYKSKIRDWHQDLTVSNRSILPRSFSKHMNPSRKSQNVSLSQRCPNAQVWTTVRYAASTQAAGLWHPATLAQAASVQHPVPTLQNPQPVTRTVSSQSSTPSRKSKSKSTT